MAAAAKVAAMLMDVVAVVAKVVVVAPKIVAVTVQVRMRRQKLWPR